MDLMAGLGDAVRLGDLPSFSEFAIAPFFWDQASIVVHRISPDMGNGSPQIGC